jgi:hypothetical protein
MKKVKGHFAIRAGDWKMILKWILKTVLEGVDCVHMTQDSDRQQVSANTVLELRTE